MVLCFFLHECSFSDLRTSEGGNVVPWPNFICADSPFFIFFIFFGGASCAILRVVVYEALIVIIPVI